MHTFIQTIFPPLLRWLLAVSLLTSLLPPAPVQARPVADNAESPRQGPARQESAPVRAARSNFFADLNGDQQVNGNDLRLAAAGWNCATGDACFSPALDRDGNGVIDLLDLAAIGNEFDVDAPQITLTNPTPGALLASGPVQVSGSVADEHAIAQLLVNGVETSLNNGAFSAAVPATGGPLLIQITARDALGLSSAETVLVTVDGSGPVITVQEPRNRQAVYSRRPTVTLSYRDQLAAVAVETLQVTLQDEGGGITDLTGQLSADANGASGTPGTDLQADESYTLTVQVADANGNQSTHLSAFYVPANADALTPPQASPEAGFVSGRVYDASSCAGSQAFDPMGCTGVAGATVTLEAIDGDALALARAARLADLNAAVHNQGQADVGLPARASQAPIAFRQAVPGTIVTGPDGFFAFPVDQTGNYALRVEKAGFTYGQRLTEIVRGKSAATTDIYLTPLDAAVTPCDGDGCQHASADGQMEVDVPAGAIPDGETVNVQATEFDQVQFLPSGELPPGTGETYAFNLSGASEITFTVPVTVRVKNDRGFGPGTEIPLGYWNQDLQVWEHAGLATVDATGEWLAMQVTHFSNFDPNAPVTPATLAVEAKDETKKPGKNCASDCDTSQVDLATGALQQAFSLPTVQVLDQPMGPSLLYNANRANANAVIDVALSLRELAPDALQGVRNLVQAELFIEGESTDQFSFRLGELESDGEIGRFRYFWDGRNAQGDRLPPGAYDYRVLVKIPFRAQFFASTTGRFGGPPDPSQPLGVFTNATAERAVTGVVVLNGEQEDHLGTGWQVADVQRLYHAEDGSIVIDDGDQTLTHYFFPRNDLTQETPQVVTLGQEKLAVPVHLQAASSQGFGLFQQSQPSPFAVNADEAPVVAQKAAQPAAIAAPATDVSDDITEDTVWTLANSPYNVRNDITVQAGAVLTVEAGVQVRVDSPSVNPASLFVEGELIAQGAPGSTVDFTSEPDDSSRHWGGIVVQNGGRAHLIHTELRFGGRAPIGDRDAGLAVISSTLIMSNSLLLDHGNFSNRPDGCLYVQSSAVTLIDTIFDDCGSPVSAGTTRNIVASVVLLGEQTTVQANNVTVRNSHRFPLALDFGLLDAIPAFDFDKGSLFLFGGELDRHATVGAASGLAEFLYTDDLTIGSNAALTVTEGVRWSAFETGTQIQVQGNLVTLGSAQQPVVFTSDEDTDGGDWAGIFVDGGRAEMAFTSLRFGGRLQVDGHTSNLIVKNGDLRFVNSESLVAQDFGSGDASHLALLDSSAFIDGSLFSDNQLNGANPDVGVEIVDTAPQPAGPIIIQNSTIVHRNVPLSLPLARLDGISPVNTFTTGASGRILIQDTAIDGDVTLGPLGNLAAYQFDGDVTVTGALTLEPGTTLLSRSRFLRMDGGTLTAHGTTDAPIIFASLTGDLRSWDGLQLQNGGQADLEFVEIREAFRGIDIRDGSLSLQYSVVRANEAGIFIDGTASEFFVHLNEFSANTTAAIQNRTNPRVTLDVRLNFWGHPSGPTNPNNPGGTGDVISGPLLFQPFLNGADVDNAAAVNLTAFDVTQLIFDIATQRFVRHYPDGTEVHFDQDGRQERSRDPAGNEIRYSYNGDGSLAAMAFVATGRADPDWTWTFAYGNGERAANQARTVTITDPAGRTTTLTLDKNGDLTALQEPGLDRAMTFAYGPHHNMTHKSDARGHTTTYEYDDNGRLVRSLLPPRQIFDPQTGQFSTGQEVHQFLPSDSLPTVNNLKIGSPQSPNPSLSKSSQLASQQIINGRSFTHSSNEFGAQTGFTDPLGQETAIQRDERDRLVRRTTPLGNCVTFTYDENDNVLTRTEMDAVACAGGDGLRRTVTFTYEARFNQVKTMTDPEGKVTRFEYDYEVGSGEAGLLVKKILPAVDDGQGNTVNPSESYSYNEAGQRTETVDALGRKSCLVYTTGGSVEAGVLFANGVTPVPGLLTQEIEDCGGVLERTTTYRNFDAAGNPQTVDEPFGAFTRSAAGHDVRTTQQTFDARNRLVEAVDPLGGVTRLAYDNGDNIVQTVDDASGRPITQTVGYNAVDQPLAIVLTGADGQHIEERFGYNLDRRRTFEQDGNGNVTTFEYNELTLLVKQTDPEGGIGTFAYDADDRLVQETDERGVRTTRTYDGLNRLVSQTVDPAGLALTTAFTYDANNNVLTETDASGVVTCFTYDGLDRLISIVDDCGNLNATRRIIYDLNSNVIKRVDPLGREEGRTHDALNRIVTFVDPLGQTETVTYDAADNATAITDEGGHTTRYTFDARDRNTAITDALGNTVTFTYDSHDNLIGTTDPLGNSTQMQFDGLDRQVMAVNENGDRAHFGYDANGNVILEIDELGRTTHYQFDGLDREIRRIDPLGQVIEAEYDAVGNVVLIRDEIGDTLTMVYDAAQRLVQTTDPRGQTTTMAYDAVGNQTAATDPLGQTVAQTYDALNRTTRLTDANGNATEFVYDLVGNLLSLRDANDNRTTFTYDVLDRRVSTTDPLNATSTVTYDARGNVTQINDGNGRVRQFVYDALSRRTAETWVDGDYAATFAYDAAGRLVSAADPFTSHAFAYDPIGRLIQMDETPKPARRATAVVTGFAFSYDAVGNLIQTEERIGSAAGAQSRTQYDALDRPVRIIQAGAGASAKRIDLAYNARGHVSRMVRFADLDGSQQVVVSTMTYDAESQLTGLVHTPANGPAITYGFTYDDADRIVQMGHSADGASNYGYDAAGQLRTASHVSRDDEAYTYDGSGNRGSHTMGSGNQLLDDGLFRYEYDAEGNRTRRINNTTSAVTEYSYDFLNRLTRVVDRDGGGSEQSSVAYVYNVLGERIERSDSQGTVQQFGVQNGLVHFVIDGNGALTNRYLHGPATDLVLADERSGGETLFPLTDHQRTARDLLDGNGSLRNHRVFDSFGNLTDQTDGSLDYLFGYIGRELDPLTGLNFHRARYYDAQVGRFISQDPIGFDGGDPNLYRYASNDPLRFTDADGLNIEGMDSFFDQVKAPSVSPSKVPVSLDNGLKPGDIIKHDPNNPLNRRLQEVKRQARLPVDEKKQAEKMRKIQEKIDRINRNVERRKAAFRRKVDEKVLKNKRLGGLRNAGKKFILKAAGKVFGAVDAAILYNDAMLRILGVAEAHNRFAEAARRERERELKRILNDAAVRKRNAEIRARNEARRLQRNQEFREQQAENERFEAQFERFAKQNKGLFGLRATGSVDPDKERALFEAARKRAKNAPVGPGQITDGGAPHGVNQGLLNVLALLNQQAPRETLEQSGNPESRPVCVPPKAK